MSSLMMRFPYLAAGAWGRSAWTSPDENEWDPVAQAARPTTTRTGAPLAGQYEEDVQRYDDNLRPTNPSSLSMGRTRRKAANNILSIIGVVDKTNDTEREANAQKQAKETPYLIPVFFLTRTALLITAQWILNITNRLLAYPSSTDTSLTMIISHDYAILGPWAFFFSGIPATICEFFVRPSWLAPISTYWIFKILLANISDLSFRNYMVRKSPLVYRFFWCVFELLDFPFRLNELLQQLGLVKPFVIGPSLQVFHATYGSPLHILGTPLPAVFLYGPLSHFLARSAVKPRVTPFINWLFASFNDDDPKGSVITATTPATNQPGLRGLTQQEQSSATRSPEVQINRTGRQLGTRTRPAPPVCLLVFDNEVDDAISETQVIAADSSTTPITTPPGERHPQVAQSPPEQSGTDAEAYHQIRISGHENADGAVIEELNISFVEHVTEATSESEKPNNSRKQVHRNRSSRHELPLSDTPQRMAEALLTAHITSILLQPMDAWILPRLARWWVTTQGATSPYPLGLNELAVNPFFSTDTFQYVMSKASKLILCIAIRQVIMAGVWTVHTNAVVWLGNWKLGWSIPGNKRTTLP